SGDSATSNVLVLVDGIARNQQDLSGTDYSSISLTQIERIEIIRGPSTVRYGSGASNGVINILTRAQPKGSALELSSRYNSYDNASFAAKTSLAGVDQSIAIKTDFANNTGYRQHNALRTRNTSLYWRLGNNKQRFFSVTARKHDDAYQLPGPLSRADLDSGTIDRRDAEPARSSAGSSDNESYALRLQFFNDDEVTVRGIAYYDDQSRDFVFASSPGNFASLQASPSAERDRIQSYTHGADLLADWQPDRAAIALYAGLAFRHSRYSRTDGGRRRENRLINEGALNSGAAHVFGEWQASHSLRVNAGYRRAITSSTFRSAQLKQNENSPECTRTNVDLGGGNIVTIVDDCPLRDEERERDEQRWHNEALEMGASLQPSSNHAYYINFAKSYRNPNIDELALKPSGEDSLRPQRAGHIEAGYRYAGESISAGLALFHSRTRDEIIFRTDGQL
ncbi:MAG: TonB-dependent receptor, partial [Pseudomonadales bacterium]|nr:TonB-dependent receptor [Pseudomonadales bacterium]